MVWKYGNNHVWYVRHIWGHISQHKAFQKWLMALTIGILGGCASQRSGNIPHSRAIWEESSALHYFTFLCEQGVCHYESCFEWLFQALPYSSKMILVAWLLVMRNWERKGKRAVEGWLRRECKRHESGNKICFGIIQKVHYKHQKGVLICCFILL